MLPGDVLLRIVVGKLVVGAVARNGVVVDAAPAMSWACGRPVSVLENWVRSKGGRIHPVLVK